MSLTQTFPSDQDIHQIETHALSGLTISNAKSRKHRKGKKMVYDASLHDYVMQEIDLPEIVEAPQQRQNSVHSGAPYKPYQF